MMFLSAIFERAKWTGVCASVLAAGVLLIHAAKVAGAKGKPGGGDTPRYDLVWLGELSFTNDINELGQVVGHLLNVSVCVLPEDTDLDGAPDLWFRDADGDGMNDLAVTLGWLQQQAPLERRNSDATAVNDLGQVVGYSTSDVLHAGGYPLRHAFLWEDLDGNARSDPGEMIELGVLTTGGESVATDINNDGLIVGHTWETNRGFVVTPDDTDLDGVPDSWFIDGGGGVNLRMVDLGSVSPYGVNELGWIVGEAGSTAFVIVPEDIDGDGTPDWFADADLDGTNDLMIALPCLPNAGRCWASSANSLGQIVGMSLDGPSGRGVKGHAMLWEPDGAGGFVLNDLGTVKGEDSTVARDINDSGQIVGYGSSFSRNKYSFSAFYWENGVMSTLDSLITGTDRPCPFDDHRATAINSSGEIAGIWQVTSRCAGGGFVAVPSAE